LFVQAIHGQDPEKASLITDRPDQTESSVTVPLGALQIETGFIYERNYNAVVEEDYYGYGTTLLRYGIASNWELRFGMAYQTLGTTTLATSEEVTSKGLTPVDLGIKIYLSEERGWRPEMAILTGVTLPGTGLAQYSVNSFAPSMRFSFSHTLTQRLSLGYNLGAEWDGANPEATGIYTLVLGFGATERIGMFIEVYGNIPEGGPADHRFDTGITFLIADNFQLDMSGGLGLNSHSADGFINAGFSWRIPH
jgi:hypothetical protein